MQRCTCLAVNCACVCLCLVPCYFHGDPAQHRIPVACAVEPKPTCQPWAAIHTGPPMGKPELPVVARRRPILRHLCDTGRVSGRLFRLGHGLHGLRGVQDDAGVREARELMLLQCTYCRLGRTWMGCYSPGPMPGHPSLSPPSCRRRRLQLRAKPTLPDRRFPRPCSWRLQRDADLHVEGARDREDKPPNPLSLDLCPINLPSLPIAQRHVPGWPRPERRLSSSGLHSFRIPQPHLEYPRRSCLASPRPLLKT